MMFVPVNSKDANSSLDTNKLILKNSLSGQSDGAGEQTMDLISQWADRLVKNNNTISYQTQNYASDKKNKLQNAWKDLKNKFKTTFVSTTWTPLTFYEFHMLDHLHKLHNEIDFSKIAASIPENPFIPNYLNILKFTKQVALVEQVEQMLRKQTISEIDGLIKKIEKTKFATQSTSIYNEVQVNILLMILTFHAISVHHYNPYKRRTIKRVLSQLSCQNFMNTTQVLRYLQNERPQIQLLPQLSQQQINSRANTIIMRVFDQQGRKGTIPKIKLQKVSQHQRRKVVNILVSGFLSQDQDKKSQWASLLSCMPDSEVYGLDWESETINSLVGFMASSVKDLLFTQTTLQDKFIHNPFNPAFDVAQDSGRYLANIVYELFPDQFVNIIGYSLGTELIKQFMTTTLQLNRGKRLQRIVLLGGVSDTNEYYDILNLCEHPLSLTNMYTANDSVLQVLLKKCRKNVEPIGLKQLTRSKKHCVDNTDVSEHILGHLAYMMKFGKIADMLELNEQ